MATKLLAVPFFSHLVPSSGYRSSVLAAVGMCLSAQGVAAEGLGDTLWQRCLDLLLLPLSMLNLKALIHSCGCKDTPTMSGTLDGVRLAIDEKSPCILHGFFDRFGHVMVVKGYTPKGLIVNDAAGEWTTQGYRSDLNGEGLIYSYDAIAQLCSPESVSDPKHLWFHRIDKPSPQPSPQERGDKNR